MNTIIHEENGKYLGQTKFVKKLLLDSLVLSVQEVSGVACLGDKWVKLMPDKMAHKAIKLKISKDSDDYIIDVHICTLHNSSVASVAYRVQEAVINTAAQLTDRKIHKVNIFIKGAKYEPNVKQK